MSGEVLDDPFAKPRREMVEDQLRPRGLRDERVLAAMQSVPRHEFVPDQCKGEAYADRPLPIGKDQTISQPYTVAFMCEALQLDGSERVLEVGTGSGYGAAVLSRLARQVDTIERIPEHADRARERLARVGCQNVTVFCGDGSLGLPDRGPYDAIVVTAGADRFPEALGQQLAAGGRLVIPIGPRDRQTMWRYRRDAGGLNSESLGEFLFVPLILGKRFAP